MDRSSKLQSQNGQQISVVVRFSAATYSDLKLPPVKLNDLSICWLRRNVRLQATELKNKRLRFILSGRVLNDKTNFKEEYQRFFKFNKPARSGAYDQEGGSSSLSSDPHQPSQDKKFYIHCLIGDELTPEDLQKENELDVQVQEQSTTTAPVGFDRLASAGFSQEDINTLRQQFRQLYGDLPANNSNGEDEGRDIRQLEERWIDSSVNEMDEFNGNNVGGSAFGGNEDLLIGILIGCLLGVVSLFLLKVEGLLNKRQKMAVVAGFIVNFSFALVRQWA